MTEATSEDRATDRAVELALIRLPSTFPSRLPAFLFSSRDTPTQKAGLLTPPATTANVEPSMRRAINLAILCALALVMMGNDPPPWRARRRPGIQVNQLVRAR